MSNEYPPVPPPPPEGGLPSYGSASGGHIPPHTPQGGGYEHLPPQQNSKALWALILSLLGFFCCGPFTSIPAMILGLSAKKSIAASGGRETGSGMATAGFWIGLVTTVLIVVGVIFTAIAIASMGWDEFLAEMESSSQY